MKRTRNMSGVAKLLLVASAASVCVAVVQSAPPTAAVTPIGSTAAGGSYFSLVLQSGGVAMGFGLNSSGQLANPANNNTANPNPTPTDILPSNLVAVEAGANWGVGLDSFGRVWTFGNNRYGQLGRDANTGTDNANPVSTLVPGLSRVTAISAGAHHTLALLRDGTVWGFGTNSYGELGEAIAVGAISTAPVKIGGLPVIVAISAGEHHTLALAADGTVWGFGFNYYGQTGNTTNNGVVGAATPKPTKINGLTNVSAISAGSYYSLALTSDGGVWGFGNNGIGQLGRTTSGSINPAPARANVPPAIAISANGQHSLVLQANHTVYSFGGNYWGQLGRTTNNGTNNATVPGQIANLFDVTSIAGGEEHSLAVRANGSVVTFGRNVRGELALAADIAAHPTPTQVIASGIGQPPSFASVVPARLLDTRPTGPTIDGIGSGGDTRGAGSTTPVQVVGRGGVPLDATTVALNVTVTGALGTGYITVYPCGSTQPLASNLNYQAGSTIANAVIAKVGGTGNVCLYTSAPTQLIVDVNGYYRDSNTFGSLNPARLLDTRPDSPTVDGLYENLGPLEANSTTMLSVDDRGGVPPDATAVALNVTVTEAQARGYITVYPCGSSQPNASNVNFDTGSTIANAVIVKVGTAGNVCFFASARTQLIVDVNAFFRDSTWSAPLEPARLLDSRPGAATIDGASAGIGLRPGDSVTELLVAGRGGVPDDATAAVLNVTVTEPQGNGFVTVFPCGSPRPNASNINYFTGLTIANLVIAKVGDDGKVCLYTLGATHLIADANTYYS